MNGNCLTNSQPFNKGCCHRYCSAVYAGTSVIGARLGAPTIGREICNCRHYNDIPRRRARKSRRDR